MINDPEDERNDAKNFLRMQLPILADSPIIREELCLYTAPLTNISVLGFGRAAQDVLVASPCSGHGFKFAALNGRILADLATSREVGIDLAPWSWDGLISKDKLP